MIHGATIRWPSATRTTIEQTTIPVSHKPAGIATARARAPVIALIPAPGTGEAGTSAQF